MPRDLINCMVPAFGGKVISDIYVLVAAGGGAAKAQTLENINKMADKDKRSGFRTLLLSVLLSAPGPLVLGLGLMVGHSSTQISDFTRRTAELMALIVSFVLYYVTNRNDDFDEIRKAELERKGNTFVGIIMCISGLSMIIMTMLSDSEDKGNVIPALVIAALGAATNTFFWRRYTFLHKRQGNSILGVQARLYGAKSFVDICVTAALAAVLTMPGTKVSLYIDTVGSVIVSMYMIYCGIRTIKEFDRSGSTGGLQSDKNQDQDS